MVETTESVNRSQLEEGLEPFDGAPAAVTHNVLEAIKLMAHAILVEVSELSRDRETREKEMDLATELERFEISMIQSAMVRSGGRQRKAAKMLGLRPTTLHSKLRKYKIIEISNER